MITKARTECSGDRCNLTVSLDINQGTATTHVPSNRRQGSLHVPAHTQVTDLVTTDDYLWMWDCPVCEYANSWTEHEGA